MSNLSSGSITTTATRISVTWQKPRDFKCMDQETIVSLTAVSTTVKLTPLRRFVFCLERRQRKVIPNHSPAVGTRKMISKVMMIWKKATLHKMVASEQPMISTLMLFAREGILSTRFSRSWNGPLADSPSYRPQSSTTLTFGASTVYRRNGRDSAVAAAFNDTPNCYYC